MCVHIIMLYIVIHYHVSHLTHSTPLVNELAVVLHHIMTNKRVAGCLAVPGSTTAMAAATPMSVQRLSFAPGASPATPLTTPGGQLYSVAGKGAPHVAAGPPVHPQRLFQSPLLPNHGDAAGAPPLAQTAQAAGPSRLAGTTKNPLFDLRHEANAAGDGATTTTMAPSPSMGGTGRDLVPPLALPGVGIAKPIITTMTAGLGTSRTPGRSRSPEPRGAGMVPSVSPGPRTRTTTTASSRARQISKEELSKRMAAREARAAAARAGRGGGQTPSMHGAHGDGRDAHQDLGSHDALDGGVQYSADDAADMQYEAGRVAPDAMPGVGLGSRHWHPTHAAAVGGVENGTATDNGAGQQPYWEYGGNPTNGGGPRLTQSLRTKRIEAYKTGPSLPVCGDLFLIGQPPEGPPHCPLMPEWWSAREYQTTDFLLLVVVLWGW